MPRKSERYTERARPHRKGARPGDASAATGGWRNPVVLIAIAGLVAAAVLIGGFFVGSHRLNLTAQAPTAGPEMAGITDTISVPTIADMPTIAAPAPEVTQYAAPEDQHLDPQTTAYFVTIDTPHGPIVAQLWPDIAPKTVNSFVYLARQGFYDGLTFHRVEPEFVIQGGDPLGTGMGGPGYSVEGEFNADNPVPHRAGTLAMARASDVNSAGSQFYIVTQDSPSASSLDGQYTVFGHVIQGMDAVRAMQVGDAMSKVTIEEKPIAESVVSPDDIRQGKLPAND
jgi:cyclophilin family peptidyl-prolyl cis-trans isomerase